MTEASPQFKEEAWRGFAALDDPRAALLDLLEGRRAWRRKGSSLEAWLMRELERWLQTRPFPGPPQVRPPPLGPPQVRPPPLGPPQVRSPPPGARPGKIPSPGAPPGKTPTLWPHWPRSTDGFSYLLTQLTGLCSHRGCPGGGAWGLSLKTGLRTLACGLDPQPLTSPSTVSPPPGLARPAPSPWPGHHQLRPGLGLPGQSGAGATAGPSGHAPG